MENEESRTLYRRVSAIVVLALGGWAILHWGPTKLPFAAWKLFYFYLAAGGAVVAALFEYRPGMAPEDVRKMGKKWFITSLFFMAAAAMGALGWTGLLRVYIYVVATLAVGAILLQSGRGGGLAASFGGVGGDSLLGARSATPIAKATYVMLALVLFSCLLIGRVVSPPASAAAGPATTQQPAGPVGNDV